MCWDDILKAVERSEKDNGERTFEMVPGVLSEDGKVEVAPKEERRHAPKVGRKAPPLVWTEQAIVKAAPCPARKKAIGKACGRERGDAGGGGGGGRGERKRNGRA